MACRGGRPAIRPPAHWKGRIPATRIRREGLRVITHGG
jgi:hypothetical protein